MVVFRLGLVIAFCVIVGRLFQLQVIRGADFQTKSSGNRLKTLEVVAPRGVVYDRNGTILARNKPSFEIALVPEDLPEDKPETPDIDEEGDEIARVLSLVHADTDPKIALRVAEIMFRTLGRFDYAKALTTAGFKVDFVTVPGEEKEIIMATDLPAAPVSMPFTVPDISTPLPLPALVQLVKFAIDFKRQGSASEAVSILDSIERIKALEFSEESYHMPAMRINPSPIRQYVYANMFSHVLGFMGPIPAEQADQYTKRGYNLNEKVGLSGLEYSYQDQMRGLPGYKTVERDILGREVRTIGQVQEPILGSNLVLNIDLRLQRVMSDALQSAIVQQKARWGVTIAMNPQNGAILGLVSQPSFDNNVFAERLTENEGYQQIQNDKRRPLLNYAIGGQYPPGSTFKMVISTAALAEGVVGPDTTIMDAGPIYLVNQFFPNDLSQAQKFVSWNHRYGIVHGPINVVQALSLSNDIFFYEVGGGYPVTKFRGLGSAAMAKWAELFGYGAPTGIDLPGEIGALVPTAQWKRQRYAESWTTGDSYNMAIGQGYMLATPLQVLVNTATVANGGTVYQPQIVYQLTDAQGHVQRDFTPKVVRQLPLQPGVMDLVRKGMWEAVNAPDGTAITSKIDGIEVAGKTGTAEFCDKEHYNPKKLDCLDDKDFRPSHAWYVAFAPYENPEIAVVTFVFDGGEGSLTAIPVTKKILETYFKEIHPR
ncbi:MAG: penicillin-binding protein 2 [Chloroflexi bacterium]|nr:penicillin-binding protein 2 [Chloroflexota bacterium]